MRTYMLFIAILIFVIQGCNNQEKLFEQGNKHPEITFSNSKALVLDSIKLSLKNSQKQYVVNLKVKDLNRNLKELRYDIKAGEGKFFINGVEQTGGKLIINPAEVEQKIKTTYVPSTISHSVIEFSLLDKFDKKSSATLELVGFQNVPPISNFTITPQMIRDQRQYLIDASKSFDQDQNFGGGIVWYKYKFNEIEKITKDSTCKYIFPATQEGETGIWKISVSVQDTDGSWSQEVSNYLTIR